MKNQMTREQFVEISRMVDEFKKLVVQAPTEIAHAVDTCVITARRMAQGCSDEEFTRTALGAWGAIYSLLDYVRLKTDYQKEFEEVNGEAIYILLMMDAANCGTVLYW